MKITDEFDAALRDHAAMLDGIPADRFVPNLDFFTEIGRCGTLACSAGWARLKEGFPFHAARVESLSSRVESLSYHTFSWQCLFGARSESRFDRRAKPTISDKDLCLFRICSLLLRTGRQISPEYQRRMKEWTR